MPGRSWEASQHHHHRFGRDRSHSSHCRRSSGSSSFGCSPNISLVEWVGCTGQIIKCYVQFFKVQCSYCEVSKMLLLYKPMERICVGSGRIPGTDFAKAWNVQSLRCDKGSKRTRFPFQPKTRIVKDLCKTIENERRLVLMVGTWAGNTRHHTC